MVRADLPFGDPGSLPAPGGHCRFYASVGTGLAYNVPLPLVIRQSGHPDLRLTAHHATRPFFEVPYYDVKVGVARRQWACELELIHHKLYLVNRPVEVDTFEITHGYNPILVNVVRDAGVVSLRGGVGILLAHPQSTVRGLRFPETGGILGWYVSGPAAQVGLSKSWELGQRISAGVEGKLVGAWARVPIVNGSADVPNLSLHGLASVGWRF
ncbi:hypothetical protein FJY68_07010 [candidate division WOR-3 bacterium]|uniref:Uncharacterized protein n=1 Tax=candidate division WOR-3 bacterium TaxID=2052148 RepID=A0A938BU59_UNCW3|nr:hypothetical protein [candidate division WOR-3 bacterium]